MKFTKTLFLLFFLSSYNVIAGDGEDEQFKAKSFFMEGAAYFNNGEFQKAADSFREAYKYKPAWKLFYNIAQAEAASGRYGVALENFESYLAKGKDNVPEDLSAESIKEISRLRMLVGTIDVDAPPGTQLLIDDYSRGETPFDGIIRVAVGKHHIVLKYNDEIIFDKSVNFSGSLTTKVTGKFSEKSQNDAAIKTDSTDSTDTPDSDSTDTADSKDKAVTVSSDISDISKKGKGLLAGAIVSAVLAAGGLGTGIAFTVKRIKDIDKRDAAAKDYLDSVNTDVASFNKVLDADDAMKTDKTLMIAGFAVGGALTITSAVLFALFSKEKKKKTVSVYPALNGLQITF